MKKSNAPAAHYSPISLTDMANTILGISPGTRSFGIAVLDKEGLSECQVRTFKGQWSKGKMMMILNILEKLYGRYGIEHVALKETLQAQNAKNARELIRHIIARAKRNGISVSRYTIHDLKREVAPSEKHSMEEIMEFLSVTYPMLKNYYLKEKRNLNSYYVPVFEAVAVARVLVQDTKQ